MRGFFFFQAEDGIRDYKVTGVQTCALPISKRASARPRQTLRQFLQTDEVKPPTKHFDMAAGLLSREGVLVEDHARSEERRVGEEGRSRGGADHLKKKKKKNRAHKESDVQPT